MSTETPKSLSSHFLARMYKKLKELAGDKLSKEDFDAAVTDARAHAGGMAKAEKSKNMSESLSAFINRVQSALYDAFRTNYSGSSPFSWAKEIFDNYVIACSNIDGKDYKIPFSTLNDEIQFGEPIEVQTEYVEVGSIGMHEVADLCADGRGCCLFNEFHFADAPEWFNFLPKPGKYNSPNYGEIVITEERNQNFVDNFDNKVYQEKLPIDCEHDVDASGAVGWIVGMRVNDDGSVDAKADWNDRGVALIEGDRFKYFSPSWFNVWTDPVDADTRHTDVAVGGALTTRPFFKEKALRPLVANERGISELAGDLKNLNPQSVVVLNFTALEPIPSKGVRNMPENIPVDPQKFAEVQTQLTEAQTKLTATETELATTKAALTAAETKATEADGRIGNLEKAARASRFAELSKEWVGEKAKHVGMLEHLATFDEKGEESDMFKDYVTQQNAAAEQLKKAGLFTEVGSSAPAAGSARAIIDAKVKQFREADPNLSEAQAFDKVWVETPREMREQYRADERQSIN